MGLLLYYLASTTNYEHLCLLFGITPSMCSCILRDMLKLDVKQFRYNPLARIKFPSPQKMHVFAKIINNHEPAVDDVIGFMNGVSLASEGTSDCVTQNVFYSDYDYDTMENNVFAYGLDGNVFFSAINFLGSWADGSLTA